MEHIVRIPILTEPEWDGKHTLSQYYLAESEVCPGEMADWARHHPEEAFYDEQDMDIAMEALDIFEEHWAEEDD